MGQIVDGVFVALVLFLTWKTLFSRPPLDEKRSERWQNDLRALAETLRTLVDEASAASSSLDRSLLQRKEELRALLSRVEEANAISEETLRRAKRRSKTPGRARASRDNLPNQTWLEKRPNPRPREELADLADRHDDRVSLTAPLRESASPERSPLAAQIEIAIADEALRRTPPVDPTTVKIARRLLAGGQEIHVVARKLGLPLAVVRALDTTVRTGSVEPHLTDIEGGIIRQRVTL